MAILTIVIVIGVLCMGTAQDTTDWCADSPYRYDIQPRSMILENDTQLLLCCQVSTELKSNIPDFSIQWYYSPMFPEIFNKTSDTIVDHGQINNTATPDKTTLWSKLLMVDLKDMEGYYWCGVNTNDSDIFYLSSVLNISSVEEIQLQACTCDDGPVTDTTQFSKFPCANNYDVMKIKDTCPHSDTGATTQVTSVANDLRTTESSEIGKNNTTTTEEVIESSIASPTEMSTNNNSTNHHTSIEITTEASNNENSTISHTNVEIMTEKTYEDTTKATNAADAEELTTAETSKRDQLDRIMKSFIIGISTGTVLSLIFLLCLITGTCILKISKMIAKRRKQQVEQAITISTPVDVYNMTTKMKLVRKESALSTSFTCEPNTSYDVTPGMIKAPSLEHVYDCIP